MKCHESSMRELVCAVGGVLQPDEGRKTWLARVARRAGISARSARAAFYGEVRGETHRAGIEAKLRDVVRKQEKAARDELAELRERVATMERRLMAIDPDFHQPSADGYREAVSAVGRQDHAEK